MRPSNQVDPVFPSRVPRPKLCLGGDISARAAMLSWASQRRSPDSCEPYYAHAPQGRWAVSGRAENC
jgi:hypothetical protein